MEPSHFLRLTIDRLAPGAAQAATLPAAIRACYIADGMASFRTDGVASTASANSVFFATGALDVSGGKDGAVILRYELHRAGGFTPGEVALEAGLDLADADGYLLRCDKVELPPGGIAYTHTHQGGGIRCLTEGQFNVQVGGKTTLIEKFGAWFEAGPDPVYGWAPDDRPGHFSRVMILPRRLKGKSSIRYENPGDADKPKPQKYTIFLDEFIKT